jgi:hypothetical protein
MKSIPDERVDFSIFSPPFADLFCYSDNPADLSNATSYKEFFFHFGFIIDELIRVTKPGRLCSVHCMDLPSTISYDGVIGIKDFTGDIIRKFQSSGWIYHARHCIWKDPLIAATRTKALGLLHKQLCKDSTISRSGIPDYLITFRKPGINDVPVAHPNGLTKYCGSNDPGESGTRSHNIWRAYASPVWMDIRQTHTLDARAGRDPEDEKHLCPLQLDVIERACVLWSNPGEVVLTPFMGVGSEVYGAILNGRKAIGIELKPSYYKQAVKNVANCVMESEQDDLLHTMDTTA